MKRTFTLFAAILLLAVGAAAQKLSYQAVVRNSANELVYDATVSVSLKILAADGVTVQYAETRTTTTNQNGLLTLIIGEHPTGTYSLANVNWTDASIKTEITLPTNEVVTNVMPVTAVSYALYADGADNNLADVTANGNSAGNRQLKDVSDPTDAQDAVTKSYLTTQTGAITASIQQQLSTLASSFQHQLDSLGGVIEAQQATINAQQHLLDSLINGGTTFTCGTSKVTDHEGNEYATVQIGNQCWMRDNLRTTTSPSTGTYLIPATNANYTYTGKQARWYNNDSATCVTNNYGLIYNWNAAVDTFNKVRKLRENGKEI